ncbi:MAG: TIGR04219 family outer membrane beta-barrel protein [Desulfobacterales bacterium]|nr:TIGR04219 family outer membrane beta-barrel protein [Desulfobacterales bacterium]MCP4162631.1 TIGR04219 family outer membrane beta-barrel protein [Deltaproteobacteria bacterium]
MKRLVFLLSIIAFLTVPTSSYALLGFGVEGAIGISKSNASGKFSYKEDLTYDLESNMGFDDTDDEKETARIKLYLPLVIPNVYYHHYEMNFAGTAAASFEYAGQTIAATTASSLDIVVDDYALFYTIAPINLATAGIVNIEVGINVRLLSIDAEVTGVTDDVDFSVPIPQIFAAVQIDIPMIPIILHGEYRSLSIDDDNECTSITGRLVLELPIPLPLGEVFIAGGYTKDIYKIDHDNVKADTEFETYFLELGYKF